MIPQQSSDDSEPSSAETLPNSGGVEALLRAASQLPLPLGTSGSSDQAATPIQSDYSPLPSEMPPSSAGVNVNGAHLAPNTLFGLPAGLSPVTPSPAVTTAKFPRFDPTNGSVEPGIAMPASMLSALSASLNAPQFSPYQTAMAGQPVGPVNSTSAGDVPQQSQQMSAGQIDQQIRDLLKSIHSLQQSQSQSLSSRQAADLSQMPSASQESEPVSKKVTDSEQQSGMPSSTGQTGIPLAPAPQSIVLENSMRQGVPSTSVTSPAIQIQGSMGPTPVSTNRLTHLGDQLPNNNFGQPNDGQFNIPQAANIPLTQGFGGNIHGQQAPLPSLQNPLDQSQLLALQLALQSAQAYQSQNSFQGIQGLQSFKGAPPAGIPVTPAQALAGITGVVGVQGLAGVSGIQGLPWLQQQYTPLNLKSLQELQLLQAIEQARAVLVQQYLQMYQQQLLPYSTNGQSQVQPPIQPPQVQTTLQERPGSRTGEEQATQTSGSQPSQTQPQLPVSSANYALPGQNQTERTGQQLSQAKSVVSALLHPTSQDRGEVQLSSVAHDGSDSLQSINISNIPQAYTPLSSSSSQACSPQENFSEAREETLPKPQDTLVEKKRQSGKKNLMEFDALYSPGRPGPKKHSELLKAHLPLTSRRASRLRAIREARDAQIKAMKEAERARIIGQDFIQDTDHYVSSGEQAAGSDRKMGVVFHPSPSAEMELPLSSTPRSLGRDEAFPTLEPPVLEQLTSISAEAVSARHKSSPVASNAAESTALRGVRPGETVSPPQSLPTSLTASTRGTPPASPRDNASLVRDQSSAHSTRSASHTGEAANSADGDMDTPTAGQTDGAIRFSTSDVEDGDDSSKGSCSDGSVTTPRDFEFSSKPALRGTTIVLDENGSHMDVYPLRLQNGRYKCSLCDKTFKYAKHVRRHGLNHSQLRLFNCNRCNMEFSRSDSLFRHQARCAGEDKGRSALSNRLRKFAQKIVRTSLVGPPVVEDAPPEGNPIGVKDENLLKIYPISGPDDPPPINPIYGHSQLKSMREVRRKAEDTDAPAQKRLRTDESEGELETPDVKALDTTAPPSDVIDRLPADLPPMPKSVRAMMENLRKGSKDPQNPLENTEWAFPQPPSAFFHGPTANAGVPSKALNPSFDSGRLQILESVPPPLPNQPRKKSTQYEPAQSSPLLSTNSAGSDPAVDEFMRLRPILPVTEPVTRPASPARTRDSVSLRSSPQAASTSQVSAQ